MDPTLVAQGGLGIALALALVAVTALWKDNRALRKQNHDDQEAMLPALQSSAEASKALIAEVTRRRVLAEHERERD